MGHKLLLADDSVTIQRVIELTFADEDIEVIAVGDGQQAIARIDAERPDVVLADIGMPERDGYEVAAHVKGTPHLSHIPVVLLTGAFEPIDEARARAVGCDGVLVKPFEPQMVINRVRDLLAGRRPSSLWAGSSSSSAAPAPPAFGVAAPAPLERPPAAQRESAPAPPHGGASLEDYFDRLDAAFADLGATPPPRPDVLQAPARPRPVADRTNDFGGWDIGLDRAPAAAASGDASSVASGSVAQTPVTPGERAAAGPAPVVDEEPLADAFAALFAAEQQSGPVAASGPVTLSEETMDEIVRRVLERMTDATVRAIVLDVAERLVREEIERIKNPQ